MGASQVESGLSSPGPIIGDFRKKKAGLQEKAWEGSGPRTAPACVDGCGLPIARREAGVGGVHPMYLPQPLWEKEEPAVPSDWGDQVSHPPFRGSEEADESVWCGAS